MYLTNNLDILSIFHFIIYLILGIYYKGNYSVILLISLLWEQFEYIISRNSFIRNKIEEFWPIPSNLWYDSNIHSLTDISINLIGYHIGNKYLS